MPFNAQGFFSRKYKWADDRDAGVNILADRMDTEMDSLADGINRIVQGREKFLGPIKGVFGTSRQPMYTFDQDEDSGIYRISDNRVGVSVGGVKKIDIGSDSTQFDGDVQFNNAVTFDWNRVNDGENSGLDADTLDGHHADFYTNASNLSSGTINPSRLNGTYTDAIAGNANQLDGESSSFYRNASNIDSGILHSSRLNGSYPDVDAGTATHATRATTATQLDGESSEFYRNASNINSGILNQSRLAGIYNIDITGDIRNSSHRLGRLAQSYYSINDIRKNGWYHITNTGNTPESKSGFLLEAIFSSATAGRQTGFYPSNGSNGNEYERILVNGVWSSWRIKSSAYAPKVAYVYNGTSFSHSFPRYRYGSADYALLEIPEFKVSITTEHYNERIKIDVNLFVNCANGIGFFFKKRWGSSSLFLKGAASGSRAAIYHYTRSKYRTGGYHIYKYDNINFPYVDIIPTPGTYEYKLCAISDINAIIKFNGRQHIDDFGNQSSMIVTRV